MKHIVGTTIAAAILASATPASADVVVYELKNVLSNYESEHWLGVSRVPLPGAGDYRFDFTSSLPVSYFFKGAYTNHWHYRIDSPEGQIIEGNEELEFSQFFGSGAATSWMFTVPEGYGVYRPMPASLRDAYNLPEGTLIYEDIQFEDLFFEFGAEEASSRRFDYSFTVTRISAVSAVPEPAAWAMMVGGFGAVGSIVRTSRRRSAFRAA